MSGPPPSGPSPSGPPPEVLASTKQWESKLKGTNVFTTQSKLPPNHRVIRPGAIVTRDFVEERINVHVDENGVCTHCTHG